MEEKRILTVNTSKPVGGSVTFIEKCGNQVRDRKKSPVVGRKEYGGMRKLLSFNMVNIRGDIKMLEEAF